MISVGLSGSLSLIIIVSVFITINASRMYRALNAKVIGSPAYSIASSSFASPRSGLEADIVIALGSISTLTALLRSLLIIETLRSDFINAILSIPMVLSAAAGMTW